MSTTDEIQRPWLATYDTLGLDWSTLPALPDDTLYRYIAKHAEHYPDRCALTLQGWELDYQALHERALKVAQLLVDEGATAGDVLAIHLPNVADYIIALAGASRLGVRVTSLSPLLSPHEIVHQLKDAEAKFLLSFAPLYGTHVQPALTELALTQVWLTGPGVEAIDSDDIAAFNDAIAATGDPALPADTAKVDDVLYLQYTGGTTGAPKAAGLTSANIFINNLQADIFYGYREGKECIASAFPMFHIGGLAVAFNAMRTAATFILSPDPRDIPTMVDEMERHPPTVIAAVPALFQMLLAEPRFCHLDFDDLIIAISGGAPFAESELAELEKVVGASKLCEVYGMAETAPVQTLNPPAQFRPGWVGVPLPGTDICIVDTDQGTTEMPLGEVGEVIASGPQVMQGYINHPDGNAKALRQFKGKTWMYTGDVGFMDQEGYLKICDRSKDMLIVGGYKVFSVEVENLLVSLPEINTCAVAGSPDQKRPGNDIVHLFIEPADSNADKNTVKSNVEQFCREKLAPYKVPKQIHFVEELPLTSVGKIDKKALRSQVS